VKKTRQNKEIEPPFRFNRNGKGSSRHKNRKRWLVGLSKAGLRWYIPLAPRGIARGRLLRKPPDRVDRRLRALARFVSNLGFSGKQAKAYRGVEQPGSSSG